MSVYTPNADVKPAKSGDCGCGCGGKCGCESRCCDLECLVRPNFFCGQLLTDADLGTMVDWARRRFALSRYRDGWGVVCGLEVTCTSPRGNHARCPDPGAGPTVYVNPGYAIDCCGNDLVVCDPIAVDLGEVCKPLDDPCAPATPPKKADPNGPPEEGEKGKEDCWGLLRGDLLTVDLTLRYHEDLAQGQRAMFRNGCSDVGPCEHTRVLERPCVRAELGDVDRQCDEDHDPKTWHDAFSGRSKDAWSEIQEAMRKGLDAALQYLRRHPPYRFCFLEEFLCCVRERSAAQDPAGRVAVGQEERLARHWVAFWLYYDWVLHALECPCGSCRPDPGVPIARVLLRRAKAGSEPQCRVMLIDTSPPHRRPLRKDTCRPIPRGEIDLAPYLWQPGAAAIDRLRLLGVTIADTPKLGDKEILGLKGLNDVVPGVLSYPSGTNTPLRAWLVRDPYQCARVAAFERTDKT